MEPFICQKEPVTIDDAVRLALKYEAFTQGRRKRLSSAKSGVRMQYEEDFPNISQNDIEEIKNDIWELKTSSNGQTHKGKPAQNNRGACFGCGQMDHMIRACRDTAGTSQRFSYYNKRQNRSGSRDVPIKRAFRRTSK